MVFDKYLEVWKVDCVFFAEIQLDFKEKIMQQWEIEEVPLQ